MQVASARGGGRGRKRGTLGEEATDRRKAQAIRQAAEGAYLKAVGTMTSNVADLSADSNMHWARELHPPARDRASALAAPSPQGGGQALQAAPDGEPGHPLRGVRFAALQAPGPSGLRPEHIAELLGVRRRRLA
eukprot:3654119-Pyramimonas_sp.AAC.1